MSTPGDGLSSVLERISGADLYRNNAFRIAGVAADATPGQIRRAREEALLATRLGGDSADTEDVRAAFETMRDPVARLTHELLWLWRPEQPDAPGSAEHDLAVRTHRTVVEAEYEGPYEPGSSEACHLDDLWTRSLAGWASVLSTREFWDHARTRVAEIGDPRLTTGTVRRLREQLPRHIASVNADLALRAVRTGSGATGRLVALLHDSPFSEQVVTDALREAVRPAERTIHAACATARQAVEADEGAGGRAGKELAERTGEPLDLVLRLLGAEATLTTALDEEVAVSLNQCAVGHYHSGETADTALHLLARAAELARDPGTAELISANTRNIRNSAGGIPAGPSSALPPRLRRLCESGKVERAAAWVRAAAGAAEDPELERQLRQIATDRRSLVSPVRGEPFLGSFLGFGVRPYGSAGPDTHGVRCATYAVTLLYVPVIPLAAYLMDDRGIHARVPLGALARWWRRVFLIVLPLVLVAFVHEGHIAFDGVVPIALTALVFLRVMVRKYRVLAWSEGRVS